MNCAIIAMLNTNSIENQLQNTMVVFKRRDSVPSASYSSVCNVLCLWSLSLIPIWPIIECTDSMIIIILSLTNYKYKEL